MRPRFRLPISLTLAVHSLTVLSACRPDSPVSPDASLPTAEGASKQATTSSKILVTALFPAEWELLSMNDDGTSQRVLSDAFDGTIAGASWAPDGKRVVLSAAIDGSSPHAIYTINDDGTGVTQLTVPGNGCEDFSPTSLGKQVVFIRGCATAALSS